jgi:hypothetical protein
VFRSTGIMRRVGHQGVTPVFAGYVAPATLLTRTNTRSQRRAHASEEKARRARKRVGTARLQTTDVGTRSRGLRAFAHPTPRLSDRNML